MAKEYKEPHLDKNGAKALMKALTQANGGVVKSANARKKKAGGKKK